MSETVMAAKARGCRSRSRHNRPPYRSHPSSQAARCRPAGIGEGASLMRLVRRGRSRRSWALALTRTGFGPPAIAQRKHCNSGPATPADKITTFEHPPSTHGVQTAPKRRLDTPDSVENAQISTGALPGT